MPRESEEEPNALARCLSQVASCGIGASDPRTEPGIASAATEMAARRIVLEPGMMVMFFEVGAAGYVI